MNGKEQMRRRRAKIIYRFDVDNEADSIIPVIDAGLVINIPCANWTTFDMNFRRLLFQEKIGASDTIVIDSIDQLALAVRMENKLGNDDDIELMLKADKIMKDPMYLNLYILASNFILSRLKMARGRGVQIVVVSHEDEEKDHDGAKKRGPKLNPAFREDLISFSTDVFRLKTIGADISSGDGAVLYKKGQRLLHLSETEEIIAKYHAPALGFKDGFPLFRDVPPYIIDPTWPKIVETLGKDPSILTIYGRPGVGKSTLAVAKAFVEMKDTAAA
jgi:hypothetical protein